MIGLVKMILKNFIGPVFRNTYKVKNIRHKLSSEEKSVDIFFDSHKKGRNKLAAIAAGAIFIKLTTEPSNSTPRLKFDSATFAMLSYVFCND